MKTLRTLLLALCTTAFLFACDENDPQPVREFQQDRLDQEIWEVREEYVEEDEGGGPEPEYANMY